jgi:hypothetical protein
VKDKKIKANNNKKNSSRNLDFNVLELLKGNSKKPIKFKKNPFRNCISKRKVKLRVSKIKPNFSLKGRFTSLFNFQELKTAPLFLRTLTNRKKGAIGRFFYLSYIRQLRVKDLSRFKSLKTDFKFKLSNNNNSSLSKITKFNFVKLHRNRNRSESLNFFKIKTKKIFKFKKNLKIKSNKFFNKCVKT